MISITVSLYYHGEVQAKIANFIAQDYEKAHEKMLDYIRSKKITRYKVTHIKSINNDLYNTD